jgi:hypothetical protein
MPYRCCGYLHPQKEHIWPDLGRHLISQIIQIEAENEIFSSKIIFLPKFWVPNPNYQN